MDAAHRRAASDRALLPSARGALLGSGDGSRRRPAIRYVSDSSRACSAFVATSSRSWAGGLRRRGARDASEALGRLSAVDSEVAPVAWRLTDASGRRRCAESTITNLLADSDVAGFVLNTRDETDRVALEEQMQRPGLSRPAHRPAQPGTARRSRLTSARALAPRRERGRGDGGRPRRLQAHQRRLRPPRRGSAAAWRGRAPVRRGAPAGHRRKLGGDVFVVLMDPAPELSAETLALAERIQVGSRARSCVRGRRAPSPRASASRSARPRTPTSTSCSATPTSRSTASSARARRRAAVRGEHEPSTRASASSCRPICARPSTARACASLPAGVQRRDTASWTASRRSSLEPSERGLMAPDKLHPAGRGDGADRAARPLGAPRGSVGRPCSWGRRVPVHGRLTSR